MASSSKMKSVVEDGALDDDEEVCPSPTKPSVFCVLIFLKVIAVARERLLASPRGIQFQLLVDLYLARSSSAWIPFMNCCLFIHVCLLHLDSLP